jgi:hypothetical protein
MGGQLKSRQRCQVRRFGRQGGENMRTCGRTFIFEVRMFGSAGLYLAFRKATDPCNGIAAENLRNKIAASNAEKSL